MIGLPYQKAAPGSEAGLLVRGAPLHVMPSRVSQRSNSGEILHWETPQENLAQLHLLVIDEDADVRNACGEIARRMGFAVVQAAEAASARSIVRLQKVDLVLMDLRASGIGALNGGGALTLLQEVKSLHPDTTVIVMTASATVASAVEAMRLGAEDYLTKPFALEDLRAILERASKRTHLNVESRHLRERLRTQKGSGPLIGRSPEMEKLYRILSKVAHSAHPVLILGESGTGKELVARSIHFNGLHGAKPFIPVDCGSLAPDKMEGQLFGYVNGESPEAGAAAKDGLLVSANGGTVFMDEISELSLDLQAKLLRALQDKAVRPVGGTHTVPMACRVLAASSRDLTALVDQGKFRRDLYFRLNVVSLKIPALRQRKEDIPELAQFFLSRAQRDSGVEEVSDDVLRTLMAYDWPGNVRELEHAVDCACAMSSGPVLHIGDLPAELQALNARLHASAAAENREKIDLRSGGAGKIISIAELERQAILGTVRHLKGDKLLAAKLLGIGKTTLYRKLKEYGMADEALSFD